MTPDFQAQSLEEGSMAMMLEKREGWMSTLAIGALPQDSFYQASC